MPHRDQPYRLRYRTVWISDVHLGCRGCRADFLLEFLHAVECETLYLVGDIVDLWQMRRGLYWPQSHNNVIRTLLGKAKAGTRVVYVPGNHDLPLRAHHGTRFGNVDIRRETVHEGADGRRFLVIHGDQFDHAVRSSRLLTALGSGAYDVLLVVNRMVHAVRGRMGLRYWSLAAFIKHRVGTAVEYIERFEQALAAEAARRRLDGVICGHIHRPRVRSIEGVAYFNTGDWMESCTALAEDPEGRLELIHWAGTPALQTRPAVAA